MQGLIYHGGWGKQYEQTEKELFVWLTPPLISPRYMDNHLFSSVNALAQSFNNPQPTHRFFQRTQLHYLARLPRSDHFADQNNCRLIALRAFKKPWAFQHEALIATFTGPDFDIHFLVECDLEAAGLGLLSHWRHKGAADRITRINDPSPPGWPNPHEVWRTVFPEGLTLFDFGILLDLISNTSGAMYHAKNRNCYWFIALTKAIITQLYPNVVELDEGRLGKWFRFPLGCPPDEEVLNITTQYVQSRDELNNELHRTRAIGG